MRPLPLALLPPLLLLPACDRATRTDAARADAGTATSDTASAAVDRQTEARAVREREGRWRAVVRARDSAAIGGFYTADGIYAPQGDSAIRGRDAVSARWAAEFRLPGFDLERTPARVEVAASGDVATETGTYRVRVTPRGRRCEVTGTYMTAWRKEGGEWRVSSYMWNRDTDRPAC